MRRDGSQNPLEGKQLRQKAHVRFLAVFPVPAVGRSSRPPDPTSDTARIDAELPPHGGERQSGGRNGCIRRCRLIQGGRNSRPRTSYS